jgi:hypothetical protein
MKRILTASLILALLMGIGMAAIAADEDDDVTQQDLLKTRGSIHGAGNRARFRTAYWAAGLTGDMKKVYDEYGYPSSRYRVEKMGEIEEKWTYLGAGKQFTFRGNRLVRDQRFNRNSASALNLH